MWKVLRILVSRKVWPKKNIKLKPNGYISFLTLKLHLNWKMITAYNSNKRIIGKVLTTKTLHDYMIQSSEVMKFLVRLKLNALRVAWDDKKWLGLKIPISTPILRSIVVQWVHPFWWSWAWIDITTEKSVE